MLGGRARLVGARHAPELAAGWISPVDARLALGLAYEDPAEIERSYFRKRSIGSDVAVLVRTLIARALAPDRTGRTEARPFVVAARVDNVTIAETVERIARGPARGRTRMVHFVHPHALNLATRDATLRAQIADADLVLPDGIGLQLAARIVRSPLQHNVNGTDLLPRLCAALVESQTPLSLIGAAPGVAQACADRLRASHPGLQIALVENGFLDDAAIARVRSTLASSGGVALVAMGSPLQERFAWTHLADIPGLCVVTVGGLFDFYSGRIPRAPQALRDVGLEWCWRLAQEPTRLARRYLVGNPLFLLRALRQRWFGPRADSAPTATVTRAAP